MSGSACIRYIIVVYLWDRASLVPGQSRRNGADLTCRRWSSRGSQKGGRSPRRQFSETGARRRVLIILGKTTIIKVAWPGRGGVPVRRDAGLIGYIGQSARKGGDERR